MEGDQFRARIFKGATRPAMMLGVPIKVAILVVGTHLILMMWTLVLFGFAAAFAIFATMVFIMLCLRYVSTHDDQRLNQRLMFFSTIGRRRNSAFWSAHSMSAIDFKRRPGR